MKLAEKIDALCKENNWCNDIRMHQYLKILYSAEQLMADGSQFNVRDIAAMIYASSEDSFENILNGVRKTYYDHIMTYHCKPGFYLDECYSQR